MNKSISLPDGSGVPKSKTAADRDRGGWSCFLLRRLLRRLAEGSLEADELSGAVSEALGADSHFSKQRELEVAQRGALRHLEVVVAGDAVRFATQHQRWQVQRRVDVRVAHAAAVEHHAVIQKRPVSVRRVLQLVE